MTRALVVALMTAGLAGGTAAEEVAVPLRIDLASVREALVAQIFTEPGKKATVWRDDTGCGWLVLSQPAVDVADGRLCIVARGEAQVGTRLGGERCLTVLAWNGFIEGLNLAAWEVQPDVARLTRGTIDTEAGRPSSTARSHDRGSLEPSRPGLAGGGGGPELDFGGASRRDATHYFHLHLTLSARETLPNGLITDRSRH